LIENSKILQNEIGLTENGEIDKVKIYKERNAARAEFYEKVSKELDIKNLKFDEWYKQYEKEEEHKSKVLGEMNNVLKSMLRSKKKDKCTQVNETEL
jgi:hypothetical protein